MINIEKIKTEFNDIISNSEPYIEFPDGVTKIGIIFKCNSDSIYTSNRMRIDEGLGFNVSFDKYGKNFNFITPLVDFNSIKTIKLPKSIKKIDGDFFERCINIEYIELPKHLIDSLSSHDKELYYRLYNERWNKQINDIINE